MTDRFEIISLRQLLQIIRHQLETSDYLFGISKKLFFNSMKSDSIRLKRFGQVMETPIGVAAGPHTQMAQNIIVAWLTGARYIELKTIQTLDELEVSKPCIDMQDEGYNCEWSQELKIKESFDQYLNAWIIIHILKNDFENGKYEGINKHKTTGLGCIFNMSVGYDLEGILKPNVQWFFDKMADASDELQKKLKEIDDIVPDIYDLNIEPQISDNITLSTMHGCPPDEIEKIGEYLLEEKKLHTAIKLNPTLLGKERLHEILQNSGFETQVPDIAFEHDLKYGDAVQIIDNLRIIAKKNELQFSLKLTNTLESRNHKDIFSKDETMMYMSGRALHPIAVNLAVKLQKDFSGDLDISFSAGINAGNIADTVACGLSPVTVCSDILKPGGYARLAQYVENLQSAFAKKQAVSIDDFIVKTGDSNSDDVAESALNNLTKYAKDVLSNTDYKRSEIHYPDIKTSRPLGYFDCIHAPCVDTCPTNQGIPDYMYHTANGDFEKAYEVITATNPFPNTTGMVCDHPCQLKCTRINYDKPLKIREIKRFISSNAKTVNFKRAKAVDKKVAIIGAGPAGLSVAYFLAKAGFVVVIYEEKPNSGGMAANAIPVFRLTQEAIDIDIRKIEELGVKIFYNAKIDKKTFEKIRKENDFVFIGTGAQKDKRLNIRNIGVNGVLSPLEFLFSVKREEKTNTGKNIVIIGGGNTAMDAARTAYRLVGKEGKVTIVYRRTIKQMPADFSEIKPVMEEGIEIMELVSPVKVNAGNGRVSSLTCVKMKLGEKDDSGRERPVEIPGSEFEIPCDTIIPAIGQDLDIDFVNPDLLKTKEGSYETQLRGVFIGGDALRGASTVINAIGDGRKAAQEIIDAADAGFDTNKVKQRQSSDIQSLIVKKSRLMHPVQVKETPISERQNFDLVTFTMTKDEAMKEAARCLLCDEICNVCVSVCPNLAFFPYETEPVNYELSKISGKGEISFDEVFEIKQQHQILHIADWCNECGNCSTFCPTAGKPFKDKPHLYLNKKAFDADFEGYFMKSENKNPTILYKENGQLFTLIEYDGHLVYKSSAFNIILDRETLKVRKFKFLEKNTSAIKLRRAAEMYVILKATIKFLKR